MKHHQLYRQQQLCRMLGVRFKRGWKWRHKKACANAADRIVMRIIAEHMEAAKGRAGKPYPYDMGNTGMGIGEGRRSRCRRSA